MLSSLISKIYTKFCILATDFVLTHVYNDFVCIYFGKYKIVNKMFIFVTNLNLQLLRVYYERTATYEVSGKE